MRSPLAQASRILLHFDIAAVPSKLCGDRSLRDQLQICEPPFVDLSLVEAESCWPPAEGVAKTDRLRVFAVNGSCLPLS